VCGAQRSQIQFEDEDHAVYMSFRWVTTTCLRWEPQPVTLWLYPVHLGPGLFVYYSCVHLFQGSFHRLAFSHTCLYNVFLLHCMFWCHFKSPFTLQDWWCLCNNLSAIISCVYQNCVLIKQLNSNTDCMGRLSSVGSILTLVICGAGSARGQDLVVWLGTGWPAQVSDSWRLPC